MTSTLLPPPERDIPAVRRALLRAAVLREAAPAPEVTPQRRRIRPWLVAAAVAVVAAVVAGPGIGPVGSRGLVATPVAPPTSRSSLAPPASPPSSGPPATATPPPLESDRGAATSARVTRTVAQCRHEQSLDSPVASTRLARDTAVAGVVVLFTTRDGRSYLCTSSGTSPVDQRVPTTPLPVPDERYPAVRLTAVGGGGGGAPAGTTQSSTTLAYRVSADVQRIEVRLTLYGTVGPWYEAEAHDGFAIVAAAVSAPDPYAAWPGMSHPAPTVTIADRAYDADGQPVRIDRRQR